ncbi:aspartate/glutamate racemase family protein [uncultured Cohaesibacter sp.]|uniref:aspartate/glutamate racemase family protein n=1 Tax=uncultured Cohaesibacter sp. TaxID=1002546 RepID=UPI0029C62E51|nr:aspartate/glutamate racemase family protein [uncultured Cohaesibacter sp.]
MSPKPRIVLIHATRVAIDPIESAMAELWPEAEAVNLLDESLALDRTKSTAVTPELTERIATLGRHAEVIGAEGILYTCSAFGLAVETVAKQAHVPVFKPNEAMFAGAFEHGGRVALIHTFRPAAASMIEEFEAEAKARGVSARINSFFCDGALTQLQQGKADQHDALIAQTVAGITDFDVIMLAQFSMARAGLACREKTAIPVLTSPEAAVLTLKQVVGRGRRTC